MKEVTLLKGNSKLFKTIGDLKRSKEADHVTRNANHACLACFGFGPIDRLRTLW